MPRISDDELSQRRERVVLLLQRHPEGLRETEIAEILNYDRRTVNNYLNYLETYHQVYKDGLYWCAYPSQRVMPRSLSLEPTEAVILYLAARLFVRQQDKYSPLGEQVLYLLANVMSEDIGLGYDIEKAAQLLAYKPKDKTYEDIFRTIIEAYVYRWQVRITYHPYRGQPFKTIFEPYLLEPSAIGFATYAIGYSSIVDDLRTYKVGRIQRAELLNRQEYAIPPEFPGLDILTNAWSIFHGDETVNVTLRFHPNVARRVKETNWHPSQTLTDDPDQPGYLVMSLQVADTTDLTPWIRGWGAHCEVLEPDHLRQTLMGEARRLAELYGWATSIADDNSNDGPDHSRFNSIFGGS